MQNHYPLTHKDGTADKRYAVAPEFCGYPEKRLVLRFCGEFVGSFRNLQDATLRAVGHRAVINGAPIFILATEEE